MHHRDPHRHAYEVSSCVEDRHPLQSVACGRVVSHLIADGLRIDTRTTTPATPSMKPFSLELPRRHGCACGAFWERVQTLDRPAVASYLSVDQDAEPCLRPAWGGRGGGGLTGVTGRRAWPNQAIRSWMLQAPPNRCRASAWWCVCCSVIAKWPGGDHPPSYLDGLHALGHHAS